MKRTTLDLYVLLVLCAMAIAFACAGQMKVAAGIMFVSQIVQMLYKEFAKPTLED